MTSPSSRLCVKQKKAPRFPGEPLFLSEPNQLHHLAHAAARVVTDTGACRFTAGLLARFFVITVITELLEQPFLVHDLLQALERTLDRLAFFQSELYHAIHPLSQPSVNRLNRTCVHSCYRSGQKVKEQNIRKHPPPSMRPLRQMKTAEVQNETHAF